MFLHLTIKHNLGNKIQIIIFTIYSWSIIIYLYKLKYLKLCIEKCKYIPKTIEMIKNLCEFFDIYFTCDPTYFETYFWTTWKF